MRDLFTTAVSVLADPPKNTGPDFGKASPFGLLIVVVLLICVFILVWSMNRHLKKLPRSFDEQPVDGEAIGAATTDDTVGTAGTERETTTPPHEPGG
ncbi:hypothetical protein [Mycolicibacterium rhodesiae]|uniref:Uncharacterized protein n=1 Tax=Mycolicibacterium rhodesiae TaxID=36814 RepID=A0A1X0IT01_MYCRH|nr:hypothetical protein [Mycolicibacterium rhodesiae]MCV7343684.1 hypothetical protein [Mycolicibacterium rhodesiae]ORB51368.1 hypothetical protein BST42_18365 [Mycolicibacterium rhodesiae]